MNEKQFFKLEVNGKLVEYEILLIFKWFKTNKNYIVYTDNTKDDNNCLKIYAGIFYPQDDTKFDTILEEYEWEEIDKRLKSIINNKNER